MTKTKTETIERMSELKLELVKILKAAKKTPSKQRIHNGGRKEMSKLSEPILMGLSDKIANTCMLSESELSEVKIKPILKEWKGLAQALEAEVEGLKEYANGRIELLEAKVKGLKDLIKIYQEYSILEMPREVNQKFDQLIEKLDLTF